ncbi:MAG: sigma-70 family RNA polymerase sigma factor [Chloroflexi bacterium AL-N5]|nr:sigma-70 family RNA polymerase sigma factor [Chloroflexi bacterium AL-N5]
MLSNNTTFCPQDRHTVSDDTLIARVCLRDEHAFRFIYCRYYRLVYTIALQVLHDIRSAEETTQDVFQIVWQSAPSFQTGRSLTNWLSTVARNRAIDIVRTGRHRVHTQITTLVKNIKTNSINTDSKFSRAAVLRLTIQSALDTWLPQQRRPIELAYFVGLTQQEIPKQLGEPLGTVKARMRRGLTALRSVLDDDIGIWY